MVDDVFRTSRPVGRGVRATEVTAAKSRNSTVSPGGSEGSGLVTWRLCSARILVGRLANAEGGDCQREKRVTSNLTAGFPRLVARTLRIVEISPLIGPLAWTVRLGVDSRRKISRPSAALTRARSTPNGNPSRFTSTVHRPVAVPLEPGSIPVAVEPVGREGPGTIFRPTIRRPRLLTKGRIGDGERPRVIQRQRWRFSIPRGPWVSPGVPSTATPP